MPKTTELTQLTYLCGATPTCGEPQEPQEVKQEVMYPSHESPVRGEAWHNGCMIHQDNGKTMGIMGKVDVKICYAKQASRRLLQRRKHPGGCPGQATFLECKWNASCCPLAPIGWHPIDWHPISWHPISWHPIGWHPIGWDLPPCRPVARLA